MAGLPATRLLRRPYGPLRSGRRDALGGGLGGAVAGALAALAVYSALVLVFDRRPLALLVDAIRDARALAPEAARA